MKVIYKYIQAQKKYELSMFKLFVLLPFISISQLINFVYMQMYYGKI